jgi:hypothetical protein
MYIKLKMTGDKIGTTTRIITDLTGYVTKFTEWISPHITLKNIAIVGVIWFLIWYWTKGTEEKYKARRSKLPFR